MTVALPPTAEKCSGRQPRRDVRVPTAVAGAAISPSTLTPMFVGCYSGQNACGHCYACLAGTKSMSRTRTRRSSDVGRRSPARNVGGGWITRIVVVVFVCAVVTSSRLSCLYLPPFSPDVRLRGAPSEGKGETMRGRGVGPTTWWCGVIYAVTRTMCRTKAQSNLPVVWVGAPKGMDACHQTPKGVESGRAQVLAEVAGRARGLSALLVRSYIALHNEY